MLGDCSGKSALIIGATSEIGREMINRLVKCNISNIIMTGRNSKNLDLLGLSYKDSQTKFHSITIDLSSNKEISEFKARYDQFKDIKIDYFLYCPGTCGTMDQVSYLQMKKDIQKVININFLSAVTTFESVNLSPTCSSVFVSSTNSFHPLECGTGYCTTKAALSNYCIQKSRELLGTDIRINAVAPGLIATKFHNEYFGSKEELQDFYVEHVKTTVLGHLVSVDGVANAIEFLLSDYSKGVTGTEMVVDCGETLYPDNEDTNYEEESDDFMNSDCN